MTTLQTQHLQNILGSKKVSKSYLAYFRENQRNRVYEEVLKLFVEKGDQGLTKKDIALKIGKDASQITRWFSGPGNWTLDTVSDLLLAMGAKLHFQTKEIGSGAIPNYQHPVIRFLNEPYIDTDYQVDDREDDGSPTKSDETMAA